MDIHHIHSGDGKKKILKGQGQFCTAKDNGLDRVPFQRFLTIGFKKFLGTFLYKANFQFVFNMVIDLFLDIWLRNKDTDTLAFQWFCYERA